MSKVQRSLTAQHNFANQPQELVDADQLDNPYLFEGWLDTGLGLPDRPWHDWDNWVKGLE